MISLSRLRYSGDAGLLRLQPLGAVLAQQQLQQGLQVLVQIPLVLDGPGELVLLQQLDELLELRGDQLLLALGDGLLQQGRAARIGRGGQLGHAEQHLFELLVAIADPLLLDRQLVVGPGLGRARRGAGLGGFRRFVQRGGRLRRTAAASAAIKTPTNSTAWHAANAWHALTTRSVG